MNAREPGLVRAALIGYGLAGAQFHAPLIAREPRIRLVGIVTKDPVRREAAARNPWDAEVWDDVQAVWEHAAELDLVIVATPLETHTELVQAALEAGLSVVVEKPFTGSSDEGRFLVDLARDRALMLTVFQNRRWDRSHLTIKELMRQRVFGDLLRYELRVERGLPRSADDTLDMASHLVDQALDLFGPADRVYGEITPVAERVEDAFIAITHRIGTHSHLRISGVAGQGRPRTRVVGTSASYVRESSDGGPRPGDTQAYWDQTESEAQRGVLGVDGNLEAVPSQPCGWPMFYPQVADALLVGSAPPVDATDAIACLEIVEAARLSSTEGRVVSLHEERVVSLHEESALLP